MPVLLFDIDLTLIDTAGAGREAMTRAFRALYGIDHAFDGVAFQGRTDRAILRDALVRHDLWSGDFAQVQGQFVDRYLLELARVIPGWGGKIMPGVRDLLDALSARGAVLGIATGNFRRAARYKLGHFGLLDVVSDGGFGDEHVDRADVVAAAARALGCAAAADVVVIGDTTLDVAAARANRFAAVGVATGFDSVEDLRAAGARLVLADLTDTTAITTALLDPGAWCDQVPPAAAAQGAVDEPTTPAEAALAADVAAAQEPGREIEAKFAVTSARTAEALLAADAAGEGYVLAPAREVHLGDSYWDTADRALLRAGLSLRLRTQDMAVRVTIKGLHGHTGGAVHRRLELDTVIEEDALMHGADPLDPTPWPPEMRDAVLGVTGADPDLSAICLVMHVRSMRDVLAAGAPDAPAGDAAPRKVAELVVERVAVAAPARGDDDDALPEQIDAFGEVELELAEDGAEADFAALVDWLAAQRGLRPIGESKFERALRRIAAHAPGAPPQTQGVLADMSMAEAGRLIWRRELTEVLLCESGARLGEDIEFVHDMRVATRRARASTELFEAWFDPKAIRPFVKALRRTGRRLGAVRDLDVALQKLRRHTETVAPAEAIDLYELAGYWRHLRSLAVRALLDWLDSEAYRRFVATFEAFCAESGAGVVAPRTGDGLHPVQVKHVMPVAIFDRFGAVRAYEEAFDESSSQSPTEPTLHALRIACKRLRYALEAVRHLMGDDGEALIRQLKRLQDHLGDLNDAVVARESLRRTQKEGLDSPAMRHYLAVQEETAERLKATFPEAWHAFVAPANRELLLRAITRM